MKHQVLLMLALSISLSGCASSQKVNKPVSESVADDKTRIVVTRETSYRGGGVNYIIKDGDVEIGKLSNYGDGLVYDRPAGEPCVHATSAKSSWKRYTICFEAPGGSVTNIRFRAIHGFIMSEVGTQVMLNEYCNEGECVPVE